MDKEQWPSSELKKDIILCLEILHHLSICMLKLLLCVFYSNNFFRLLIAKADFQMLLKYYRTLIPHAHTASPQFYEV